jgi:hypothetical protein
MGYGFVAEDVRPLPGQEIVSLQIRQRTPHIGDFSQISRYLNFFPIFISMLPVAYKLHP